MCKLYGAVWQCKHVYAGYLACKDPHPRPGEHCHATRDFWKPYSPQNPTGYDPHDHVGFKFRKNFINMPSCCSPQCCASALESRHAQLPATFSHNVAPSAVVAYRDVVQVHMDWCMYYFVDRRLWMTKSMRENNLIDPKDPVADILPTVDMIYLSPQYNPSGGSSMQYYRQYAQLVQQQKGIEAHDCDAVHQWGRLIPYSTKKRPNLEEYVIRGDADLTSNAASAPERRELNAVAPGASQLPALQQPPETKMALNLPPLSSVAPLGSMQGESSARQLQAHWIQPAGGSQPPDFTLPRPSTFTNPPYVKQKKLPVIDEAAVQKCYKKLEEDGIPCKDRRTFE